MKQALVAGIGVEEFYRLTPDEVGIAIDAYQERERQNLINRISAVIRGIGPVFAKKGSASNPYKGLGVKESKPLSLGGLKRSAEAWLFRDDD